MSRHIEQILREIRIAEIDLERGGTVAPDTALGEVYRVLDLERRNAVVVLDGGAIVGIFTQRDVLYRTALEGVPMETPIGDLMTREPFTLSPRVRLAAAIHAMTERGYRNVPIVADGGPFLGLLSSRRVLGFIAEHFPEAVLNLPPRLHQQLVRPEGG